MPHFNDNDNASRPLPPPALISQAHAIISRVAGSRLGIAADRFLFSFRPIWVENHSEVGSAPCQVKWQRLDVSE